jgi:hypothetical protein
MDIHKSNLSRVKKLLKSSHQEGETFLKNSKPHHIEFFQNVLHTFHPAVPEHLKGHVRKVLASTSARMAKSRMISAHKATGGAFLDYLKSGASAVANLAKKAGNAVMDVGHNVFDKAKTFAQKGFDMIKPLVEQYVVPAVKQYAPDLAKKGAQMLVDKL